MQIQTTHTSGTDTPLVPLAKFKAQLVIPAAVLHSKILPNCVS
jgi:hypothetical protein